MSRAARSYRCVLPARPRRRPCFWLEALPVAHTCLRTNRRRRQRMAIFITNDDVRKLLPMDECVAVLDDLFRQEAAGLVENLARRRFRVAGADAPPGPPA